MICDGGSVSNEASKALSDNSCLVDKLVKRPAAFIRVSAVSFSV